MDLITYVLCKKYVQASLDGAGALQGKDGLSAYEVAVNNGYTGTEKEWLQTLKGSSPTIGENGNWYIDGIDTNVPAGGVKDYNDLENLPDIPTKISQLLNDTGFIATGDNISTLNNDAGYITSIDLEDYAQKSEIPTKLSQLTNDISISSTAKMERDFTTNISVGHMKSGTEIYKTDNIADILYRILYKAPKETVDFIFGGSLSIPYSIETLSWKEELKDQSIDDILANGITKMIKTGQTSGAEFGQYPVMACTKGLKLVQLKKMVVQGVESIPLDFEMIETEEYYIYYYPTKTYDTVGTTYIFTFEEVE